MLGHMRVYAWRCRQRLSSESVLCTTHRCPCTLRSTSGRTSMRRSPAMNTCCLSLRCAAATATIDRWAALVLICTWRFQAQRSALYYFSRSAGQLYYRAVSFSAGSTVPWRCPQMVVEKFREGGLSVWKIFHSRPEVFTAFIVRVMTLRCARACTPIVTAQAPAMQSHT